VFERQWFSKGAQEGQTAQSIKCESLLREKQYSQCKDIISCYYTENEVYWGRIYSRLRHLEKRRAIGNIEIIYYSMLDFWPGIDPANCQIVDLFRYANKRKQWRYTENPEQADVVFSSCYGGKRIRSFTTTQQALHILYLGENIRPRYDVYDYSLSFDQFEYHGRNIYWPLWIFELNLFSCAQYADRKTYEINSITLPKVIDVSHRRNRILYIGNNNEPLRMAVINSLVEAGFKIDCYGSHTRPVGDKIEMASKYKVLLSPENSFYPGYCTEKIVHGYLGGCTSIIWGGIDPLLNCDNKDYFIEIGQDQQFHFMHSKIRDALLKDEIHFEHLVKKEDLDSRFNQCVQALRTILSQFD